MKNEYLPTFNKSLIITGEFYGVNLGMDCFRENNIRRVNSLVALALRNKYKGYIFEILDDELLNESLRKFTALEIKYAKLKLPSLSYLLVLNNPKFKEADITGIINENSSEFFLTESFCLANDTEDLEEILLKCYQLSKHITFPKRAKKEKQFTSSDLTVEEKEKILCLKKTPFLLNKRC